jgi:hypothetical protein
VKFFQDDTMMTIYEGIVIMAYSKNVVKEWYKDLSVEELEAKYYALEVDCFFTFCKAKEC